MPESQRPRLTIVTGKGGTGKSVIAGAFGVSAASAGRRALIVETHRRLDVLGLFGKSVQNVHDEVPVDDLLHHVTIDTDAVLAEYLADQLPGPAAALARRSRGLAALAVATPGLRELLTVGKIWEMAQPERRLPGALPYEDVIVDAPATGHGIAMFTTPRTFADAARGGPVHRQASIIDQAIADPTLTRFVAVTTAEELPVSETIELEAELRTALPEQRLDHVYVNRVLPRIFSADETDRLREKSRAPSAPAELHAALALAEQRAEQQRQLSRLRHGLGGVPATTVPALPTAEIGAAELTRIAKAVSK